MELMKAFLYNIPSSITYSFLMITALTDSDKALIGACLVMFFGGMLNVNIILSVEMKADLEIMQSIPKFMTLLFNAQSVLKLMEIVVQATDENRMRNAPDEHKRLLKKYVTIARVITNIEIFSFGIGFVLAYVLPLAISIAMSQWLDPLYLKIIGVRYVFCF